MKISLHIYHLDDGPEADFIINLLRNVGVSEEWKISEPTEETNSILVPIELEFNSNEKWKLRENKINKSLTLLKFLNKEVIDKIKEIGLEVSMRIETNEFLLTLPTLFVSECGRLGLGITIFYTAE